MGSTQRTLSALQARTAIGGARAFEHIAMREHDSLGGTGGAGREAYKRRVRDARRERRLGIIQSREA